MGKIVEFKKIEAEEMDIRPVNLPDVHYDLEKVKAFIEECEKEGYALQSCPSCGAILGGFAPYTAQNFTCGRCGAHWICENAEEMFSMAYPNAGKDDQHE